jgi:hypothetical protein
MKHKGFLVQIYCRRCGWAATATLLWLSTTSIM